MGILLIEVAKEVYGMSQLVKTFIGALEGFPSGAIRVNFSKEELCFLT
jgi:hypothetical protein